MFSACETRQCPDYSHLLEDVLFPIFFGKQLPTLARASGVPSNVSLGTQQCKQAINRTLLNKNF